MSSHDHADGDFAHPMPVWLLLFVFFSLLALTGLTVFQAGLHLGNLEVWLSLIIATIKASLVMAFFMHLAYDKPFNILMFLSSFLFVVLFIGFLLMDSNAYQDNVELKPTADAVDGGT